MDVTAVLTAERTQDYGGIARFGVEEFIADNVVILRNVLEDEARRRTIEILKFRGTDHQKGQVPFRIVPKVGPGRRGTDRVCSAPAADVRAEPGTLPEDGRNI